MSGHRQASKRRHQLTHNVLHILGSGRFEGAAVARIVSTIARGIDHDKYLLHAWFLEGDGPLADELRESGMPVRVVRWSRNIRDPKGVWRFASGLRQTRISIVHQHIGGRLTIVVGPRTDWAPLVHHLHTRVLEERGVAPHGLSLPGGSDDCRERSYRTMRGRPAAARGLSRRSSSRNWSNGETAAV